MRSKPATPTKKRAQTPAARVTDSQAKKTNKVARPKDADDARRALNFVDDDDDDGSFVPAETHRVLNYAEKTARQLPAHTLALFAFVERCCSVPADFEARHEFGPKSGTCHEERVVGAYFAGQLGGDDALRRRLKKLNSRKEYGGLVAACEAA
mmetsp:Transcript_10470/g.32219  ORF Transcript_10470/g.32219 Transcript_10470/m.32219 type:complete len:153 (-) Transcript_10470:40-498(-)